MEESIVEVYKNGRVIGGGTVGGVENANAMGMLVDEGISVDVVEPISLGMCMGRMWVMVVEDVNEIGVGKKVL